jgi:hypothetical protein
MDRKDMIWEAVNRYVDDLEVETVLDMVKDDLFSYYMDDASDEETQELLDEMFPDGFPSQIEEEA